MFESFWRDSQERPLGFPLLNIYAQFMDIKRYDHMPYYFYPQGKQFVGLEDIALNFVDHLVDAHELERNKQDYYWPFYHRSIYFWCNFHRYSNDTVANLMFDTKLSKKDYDRVNSSVDQSTNFFYAASTFANLVAFAYGSYFFRFRRLNKAQVLLVGTAYYYAFQSINSTLYKLIVDRNVISTARALGQHEHVQPTGSFKNRGLNF